MVQRHAVIVGAGVVGSSVAYQLAKAGYRVTVVDKAAAPGHGSTSASSGVVRFNYSTLDSVALAWESQHAWMQWQHHLVAPDGMPLAQFHRVGMLMMEVPLVDLEQSAALLAAAGIPHQLLEAPQIAELISGVDTGRYWPNKPINDPAFWEPATSDIRAVYTPDGGYVDDPALAAANLADAAQRHGAEFRFRAEVTAVRRAGDRVSGVTLANAEELACDIVVNAAGPWSAGFNRLAGVGADFTISLSPMRQEVHQVTLPTSLRQVPVVGDLDLGIYFRPAAGGALLIGGTEPECDGFEWLDEPDNVKTTPTMRLFEAQVTRAARRLPDLKVPGSPVGVAGVYDVSSDWTPIYDKSELAGFYLAVGTSGNQFKNAPVIGELMRDLIDAVESGQDHDSDPVTFHATRTGLDINLGAFSRKRSRNVATSGTVMG